MPIYGRGLNREITGAVNRGEIIEPFSTSEINEFIKSQNWNIPNTYINVCLANGSSMKHSKTYKKNFLSLGNGKYKISDEFRGGLWR